MSFPKYVDIISMEKSILQFNGPQVEMYYVLMYLKVIFLSQQTVPHGRIIDFLLCAPQTTI